MHSSTFIRLIYRNDKLCINITSVLVRVSIAVKRHHDHSTSFKGKRLVGWLIFSVVECIIIMVGHGGVQTDKVLEK